MKFYEKIDIEHNIVKYVLKAKYNDELTDEEIMEIETLHDYVKKIKLSDIDFSANITMVSGIPTVVATDEEPTVVNETENETSKGETGTSETVVKMSIGKVAAKEYILDENLEITFSVDAERVSDLEVNEVLTSKSLVSQAKVAIFQAKVKEKIQSILDEMRNEDNTFEQETESIL